MQSCLLYTSYQHAQYFYDLCDERGIIVWAEIPYISKHLEKGVENTISQMKELIFQNYNHPSIVVWGLSNEISMGGATPVSYTHLDVYKRQIARLNRVARSRTCMFFGISSTLKNSSLK